ncbi:MFS transporter [Actinorhabdospora filicis]|uniref:MFS transporter n=1 Tax=Actinorhabdospora filicis TaxID=1785913 RepID=A0A9W6SR61_9ACTN|nr:MFS transporter [Actinorhabdospora filicis]
MIIRACRLLPDPGPARTLTYASLIASVGRGMFVTISVIYLREVVGLPPEQIGLGMTLAALFGLFAGVPIGAIADRRGPRGIAVTLGLLAAAVDIGYLFVQNIYGLVIVAGLVSVLSSGSNAARGALIAGSVPKEQQVRTRAYLRSVTNVGWTIGLPIAGIALWAERREVYIAMILATVVLYIVSPLVLLRIAPMEPSAAAKKESKLAALKDRPYLTLTILNALLTVHYQVFNLIIPLWVAGATNAPKWIVAVLGVINTVSIVLFQVRVSRSSASVTGASRAQRNAGLLLAVTCGLYALAAQGTTWMAILILCVGGAMHVLGELLQAAGGWGLSFDLAPAHAQGQYQGLYNTGFAIAEIIAPAALTALIMGWHWRGWMILAGVFLVAGLLVPVAARWAERTRTPQSEDTLAKAA